MKVAIAHDYLTQRGGAERVVIELARAFPDASIHTTLYNPLTTFPEFADMDVQVGPLNAVRAFRMDHRRALPLLAPATSLTRIRGVDLVVASSSGWAHGVRADAPKVVYCYNPARWLYQRDEYLGERAGMLRRAALSALRPFLLRWDRRAAQSASRYVTISSVVRDRIKTAYGLEVEIIPPPPGLSRDGESRLPPSLTHVCSGFLLCVSRLLPYKNVDAVIEGASLAGEPLVIVGVGPELDRLRSLAGNHAHVLGSVSDAELRWLYANCRAVVAASFEDYGLTPLEGLSFRRPSVVLRGGGFLDTVIEDETGTFFDRPEPPLIADALRRSLAMTWNEGRLRSHASAFSRESFVARMRRLVEDVVEGDARAGVDGTSG